MKKIISACVMLLTFVSFSQAQKNYTRQQAVGISFFFMDFQTADRIRTTSLNTVIADKKFAKLGEMSPGIAINYFKGIGNHVDFAGSLGGTFLKYPMPSHSFQNDNLLVEATASVNLKMTTEQYWVQPYITVGVGGHKYRSYYGAFMPLGLGFKINFFDEAHLFISSTYRVPVTTETANYHFQHAIGIAGIIGGKKKVNEVIPTPPPPPDTDGDGVIDPSDKCPNLKGVARYGGCPIPDSDHDGINDEEDHCINVPGLARYNGCPIPDSDKDGLNDEEDNCPQIFGVVRYKGCPVPDRDKDGVSDEEDKCPDLAGTADNLGCPAIPSLESLRLSMDAKNISFTVNKLNASSNKVLDDVVKLLQTNKAYLMDIEIQSDAQGVALKSYLVKKGVVENRIRTVVNPDIKSINLSLSYF